MTFVACVVWAIAWIGVGFCISWLIDLLKNRFPPGGFNAE